MKQQHAPGYGIYGGRGLFKEDPRTVQWGDYVENGGPGPRNAVLERLGGIRRSLKSTGKGTWFEAGNRATYHECDSSGSEHPVFSKPQMRGDYLVCSNCGARTKAE